MEKKDSDKNKTVSAPVSSREVEISSHEKENTKLKHLGTSSTAIKQKGNTNDTNLLEVNISEVVGLSPSAGKMEVDTLNIQKDEQETETSSLKRTSDALPAENLGGETFVTLKEKQELQSEMKTLDIGDKSNKAQSEKILDKLKGVDKGEANTEGTEKNIEESLYDDEEEPVFDGTDVPGMESNRSLSTRSLDQDSEGQGSVWPEKAAALTSFVRERSVVAMSTVLRRLSGKSDDGKEVSDDDKSTRKDSDAEGIEDHSLESEPQEVFQRFTQSSAWNPLRRIGSFLAASAENKSEQEDSAEDLTEPIVMKGQIILYTRLGCQDCRMMRSFLHTKRLRYVEINIDVYPSRKLELEKISGSSDVPKVFFNEVLMGGLSEMKNLEESGKLQEKIEYVVSEAASFEAPLPPLSGEDDESSSGAIDELALIVQKMKDSISIKDRFYKMRRFTNCFVGSEAVDFLSEDQYLEKEGAVEFGRKLASKLFFQHVLDENMFEDGNHIYRFLDDDPSVSQCQNIPRGISEVKPKSSQEISARLRFLSNAILEAYTSEDGKHVDYRSIHGSEEFSRYLRILEELQRVELNEMSREEKLSFFINLYNMMAIHAILVWGHPSGALMRRKFFGDFKYVIGGSTYSLSAIYNGVLRGNQRPPYNLVKPFGAKDKRLTVALSSTEPLVNFTLVCGTRSGPALRCYSPGNIDKELMDAAQNFLRTGGLYIDPVSNVAYVNKILKWYSLDFGKNEVEVLKHAANYLEPAESQALLELLSNIQLKVIYQPYDWRLNR